MENRLGRELLILDTNPFCILEVALIDLKRVFLIGFSAKLRILVVVHAYRLDEKEVRIISARKATPKERQQYGNFL